MTTQNSGRGRYGAGGLPDAPPGALPESPAAERNKAPILAAMRPHLPATGVVLEIASGTAQHIVHFAREVPELVWQPSDTDEELRAVAAERIRAAGLNNVRAPIPLDVLAQEWPMVEAAAMVCINMIHIAPWAATQGLMRGAGRLLPGGGRLFMYGPYQRGGKHTAESNETFDASLRARNPEWGVRDLDDVERCAGECGLRLIDVVEMPKDNLTVVFERGA